jgi:hypothetical protein
MGFIKKTLFLLLFLLLIMGLFSAPKAHAASLSSISDTITTSRPSAAAPLASDQAAAATSVSVVDNGSTYLASDSAVIYKDTGETTNSGLNVASMSAQSSGNRNIYITNSGGVPNVHHKGDALIVNITATHTIKFTTISPIPASGHIIITFPGTGSNIASPSATGFSFNGMTTSNPTDVKYNGVTCTSITVTGSNQIDCLVNGSGVAASTTVTVLIGCTTGTTACTAFAPRLINPTKTATNICNNGQATCNADTWKVSLKTQDASSLDLDAGSAKIGTIESVQVQATVEPTLTFTITGLGNTTNVTTQNASCTGGDVTNSGLAATATTVNLGILANGIINISAQELSVSTNGSTGYSITATSSGKLINPASGFWIADANGGNGLTAVDTPVPAVFPSSGVNAVAFGIHPCGADVNTTTWANAATGFNSGAKYSNPWNSVANGANAFYVNIANFSGPASGRTTEVEYAGTVGTSTPAGNYTTTLTYVATATF